MGRLSYMLICILLLVIYVPTNFCYGEEKIKCLECGGINLATDKFCGYCGAKLTTEYKTDTSSVPVREFKSEPTTIKESLKFAEPSTKLAEANLPIKTFSEITFGYGALRGGLGGTLYLGLSPSMSLLGGLGVLKNSTLYEVGIKLFTSGKQNFFLAGAYGGIGVYEQTLTIAELYIDYYYYGYPVYAYKYITKTDKQVINGPTYLIGYQWYLGENRNQIFEIGTGISSGKVTWFKGTSWEETQDIDSIHN